MKKKMFTIDLKSAFDESLTDAEYRLLNRFCLTFGTEHCKNSEKPWLKLKLPRSTFYRLVSKLVELEYLQRNPEDDSSSLSVSFLRRMTAENPKNETEQSQKRDSAPLSESEEKRTKREEKETHDIEDGLRDKKENIKEDKENIRNTLSVSSNDSINHNINAFVEQKPEKPKRRGKPFVKPTVEEVLEYCRSRESTVSAAAFWDWYESNGWKVGKNPMKDWKAAVRTWEQKDRAAGKYFVPQENRKTESTGSGVSDECPF